MSFLFAWISIGLSIISIAIAVFSIQKTKELIIILEQRYRFSRDKLPLEKSVDNPVDNLLINEMKKFMNGSNSCPVSDGGIKYANGDLDRPVDKPVYKSVNTPAKKLAESSTKNAAKNLRKEPGTREPVVKIHYVKKIF